MFGVYFPGKGGEFRGGAWPGRDTLPTRAADGLLAVGKKGHSG